MPARDGTGPLGRGPLTGGGRGYCAGATARVGRSATGYGRGRAAAQPGCFGRGRGYRNQFLETGLPFWARGGGADPSGSKPEEAALLEDEAEALRARLGSIEERLRRLESE